MSGQHGQIFVPFVLTKECRDVLGITVSEWVIPRVPDTITIHKTIPLRKTTTSKPITQDESRMKLSDG